MASLFLALFLWLIAFALTAINFFIADTVIQPITTEYTAHLYNIVVLAIIFIIIGWIYARQTTGDGWGSSAIGAGLFWAGLSVIADGIIRIYVWNIPRECPENYKVITSKTCFLADYFIWEGRLWIIALICALLAPILMAVTMNRQ